MATRVLVVEDATDIAELITFNLEEEGYDVAQFHNGEEAYQHALVNPFDLMVLDVNLPGRNGLDICKRLREEGYKQPILMLTARSEEHDKVTGLELGADDYLTKPFGVKEMVARVNALKRRTDSGNEDDGQKDKISYRAMEIDKSARKVTLDAKRINLTPKEFDLLYLMASNAGVTYDRKDLLNQVWSYDFEGYEHTVNSHINRLRAKIETNPNKPEYVLTTWGVGYRFNDE